MNVSVYELIHRRLDAAVAIAQGFHLHKNSVLNGEVKRGWWISKPEVDPNHWIQLSRFSPSSDWKLCGPILEWEQIEIRPGNHGPWYASIQDAYMFMKGPTALIAAMRCFVFSKLGEEIEIPEDLL